MATLRSRARSPRHPAPSRRRLHGGGYSYPSCQQVVHQPLLEELEFVTVGILGANAGIVGVGDSGNACLLFYRWDSQSKPLQRSEVDPISGDALSEPVDILPCRGAR